MLGTDIMITRSEQQKPNYTYGHFKRLSSSVYVIQE